MASLLVWGCSSPEAKAPVEDTTPQVDIGDTQQELIPADVTDPLDQVEADTEVVEGAPLALSKQQAKALCKDVVCAEGGCGIEWLSGVAANSCQTTCEKELVKDPETASRLLCARSLEGDLCDSFAGCQARTQREDGCETYCSDMAQCAFFGTSRWGFTADDCHLMCLADAGASESLAARLECMKAAAAQCDSPALLECAGEFDATAVCPEVMCDAPEFGGCSLIPGEYETLEACQAECLDWKPATAYSAAACVEMNTAMPVGCDQLKMACLSADEVLPESARAYSDEVMKKCVVLEFMNTGGFGADLLAWKLAGLVKGTPELYRSFADAMSCIKELNPCPQTELAPYYCLYNITQESKTACGELATLCTPDAYADEMVVQCEATLTLLHVLVPELEQGKLDCLDAGSSCEAKAACISN